MNTFVRGLLDCTCWLQRYILYCTAVCRDHLLPKDLTVIGCGYGMKGPQGRGARTAFRNGQAFHGLFVAV